MSGFVWDLEHLKDSCRRQRIDIKYDEGDVYVRGRGTTWLLLGTVNEHGEIVEAYDAETCERMYEQSKNFPTIPAPPKQ